jgi:hypothetical protein
LKEGGMTYNALIELLIKVAEIVDIGSISRLVRRRCGPTSQCPLQQKETGKIDVNQNTFIQAFAHDAT